MRKMLSLFVISVLVVLLAGCIRTYKVVRDRVDQDLSAGNQGFLAGSGATQEPRKTTRTIYVMEAEMRSPFEKKKEIKLAPVSLPEEAQAPETRGYIQSEPVTLPEITPEEPAGQQESGITTYTVQKGDTLEKIAGRPEIYGNPKKWYRIYKANQDRLKSPNRIYPGQVLNIPRD